MLCHLLASYVIITCFKVPAIQTIRPQPPRPPLFGLHRIRQHRLRKREETAATPCLGIQGANQDQVCLADHIKELVWAKEKSLNTALNRKLHITNENKFIDEVLQLMHADGSDLLDTLNSEEQKVCRNTITQRPHKRLDITKVEEFQNAHEDGNGELRELAGITRLPLMTINKDENVHISDFINLQAKHKGRRIYHNDSHMSDLEFSSGKSNSNKMITKLKTISEFYNFVTHHEGSMLNMSGEKRGASKWYNRNYTKENASNGRKIQPVLKCSNIKRFKEYDTEFHKRNISTQENSDQKRRSEKEIDKGDQQNVPVNEESVKDLSIDDSMKRGAVRKTQHKSKYVRKKKHRRLGRTKTKKDAVSFDGGGRGGTVEYKETSSVVSQDPFTIGGEHLRNDITESEEVIRERRGLDEGEKLRHNVTIPVFSIVVNEDSNVDARTLPIVKTFLHENESIQNVVPAESTNQSISGKGNITYDMTYEYVHPTPDTIAGVIAEPNLTVNNVVQSRTTNETHFPILFNNKTRYDPTNDILHNNTIRYDPNNDTLPIYAVTPRNETKHPENKTNDSSHNDSQEIDNLRSSKNTTNDTSLENSEVKKLAPSNMTKESQYTGVTHTQILSYTDLKEKRLHTITSSPPTVKDEIDNLVSIRKFRQPSLDKVITVTTNSNTNHVRENVPVAMGTKNVNPVKKSLSSIHINEHVTHDEHMTNVTQVITPILKFSDSAFNSLYDGNMDDLSKTNDVIRDKSNALLGAMLPETNLTKSPDTDGNSREAEAKTANGENKGAETPPVFQDALRGTINESKSTVDEEFHDEKLDNATVKDRKVSVEIRDALQKAVNKAEDTLREAASNSQENEQRTNIHNNTKEDGLQITPHNQGNDSSHNVKEEFQDALHNVELDVDKISTTHSKEMIISTNTSTEMEDDIDDLVEPKTLESNELESNETINKNKVFQENTTDHQDGTQNLQGNELNATTIPNAGNDKNSQPLNSQNNSQNDQQSKSNLLEVTPVVTNGSSNLVNNNSLTNSLGNRPRTDLGHDNSDNNNEAPFVHDNSSTVEVHKETKKDGMERIVMGAKQNFEKLASDKSSSSSSLLNSKIVKKIEKKTTEHNIGRNYEKADITNTYNTDRIRTDSAVVSGAFVNTPDTRLASTKDAIYPSTPLTPASITPADGPLFPLLFSDENIATANAYDNAKLNVNPNKDSNMFSNIEHIANANTYTNAKITPAMNKDSSMMANIEHIVTDNARLNTNPSRESPMFSSTNRLAEHLGEQTHAAEPAGPLPNNMAYRPVNNAAYRPINERKNKNSSMDMLFFTTDVPSQSNAPLPTLSESMPDPGRFDIEKYPELKPYILMRTPYEGAMRPPYEGALRPPYEGALRPPYEGALHPPYEGALRPPYEGGQLNYRDPPPPPLDQSKFNVNKPPLDLSFSNVATLRPPELRPDTVRYPEPVPPAAFMSPIPSRNNASTTRQLDQVSDEPPPTPNDPFLQQLAELSSPQAPPPMATNSFHANGQPGETPAWPPSEDLIVPSFTSYESETPPQSGSPDGKQPPPPTTTASTYVSTLTPNEASYVNTTLCSQVAERKDGEEVPPDILQALAGCKPDTVAAPVESKAEAAPSPIPVQMQVHEIEMMPGDEKSDKWHGEPKPDIITQISGPTLGSSTPSYNPDYSQQEFATPPDILHQLATDKSIKPETNGEPPIAYMSDYAITPLTSTKPDSLPPPTMERVKDDSAHIMEHKEVPIASYASNQTQSVPAYVPPPVPPPSASPEPTFKETATLTTGASVAAGSSTSSEVRTIPATRMCKPGPQRPFYTGKPNCLIIGDSIALSYSYSVQAALRDDCQIQLSPSSKGGVALDSLYGEQCIEMFLSTTDFTPTTYDVIVFNFGLHDIDVLQRFPEEYNNVTQYAENLRKIKEKLVNTGASVAFALSTPVPFDKAKDDLLREYNHAAERVMKETPYVTTVDLYDSVIKECGAVPFETCYMMKRDNDVHYGVVGSIMLGKQIASSIKFLLDKRNREAPHTPPVPINKLTDIDVNSMTCPQPFTKCPAFNTCMENSDSRSGHACCPLPNAVDCRDLIHCCPQDTRCHPLCTDMTCSCIPLNQTLSTPG